VADLLQPGSSLRSFKKQSLAAKAPRTPSIFYYQRYALFYQKKNFLAFLAPWRLYLFGA
jgi:hypothetical protein